MGAELYAGSLFVMLRYLDALSFFFFNLANIMDDLVRFVWRTGA